MSAVCASDVCEGDLVRVPGPINGSINGTVLRVGTVDPDYLPGVFPWPTVRWEYVDPTTGAPARTPSGIQHTTTIYADHPVELIER